jgi:hypothetical protein
VPQLDVSDPAALRLAVQLHLQPAAAASSCTAKGIIKSVIISISASNHALLLTRVVQAAVATTWCVCYVCHLGGLTRLWCRLLLQTRSSHQVQRLGLSQLLTGPLAHALQQRSAL